MKFINDWTGDMFPGDDVNPAQRICAAWIVQLLLLLALFGILSSKHGIFTVAGGLLLTFILLRAVWTGGLKLASTGWRWLAVGMLGLNLIIVILGAWPRLFLPINI